MEAERFCRGGTVALSASERLDDQCAPMAIYGGVESLAPLGRSDDSFTGQSRR
jgi:hypothetical protein